MLFFLWILSDRRLTGCLLRQVDIDEWQEITALALDERAIKQVIWAYVKWQDLPYKLGKSTLSSSSCATPL